MVRRHRLFPASPILAIVLAALPLSGGGGCDRASPNATKPASADVPMMTIDPAAPVPSSLSVAPLATVAAARATLLAAMPDGSIYLAQAPAADEDTNDVQVISAGGSRAGKSPLTARAVFAALNIRTDAPRTRPSAGTTSPAATRPVAAAPSVSGRFTALAARSDGKLAFAFAGVNDRNPFFALGTFDPQAGTLFIPVDHSTIDFAGDKDILADPARQMLFTRGDDAWLWRVSEHEMRLVIIRKLSDVSPAIETKRLAIEQVRDENVSEFERSGWEWAATPDRGTFLLTDTAQRWIRRIDEAEQIAHVARFEADAVASLSGATLDAAGRAIVFACDPDGVAQSLLVQDGGRFKSIATSAFETRAPLNATRLQIDRLIPMPKQANTFVAYEGLSGTIVRVALK